MFHIRQIITRIAKVSFQKEIEKMYRDKEQNFLQGAAVLTVGVIIIKVLGFIYKFILGNVLGDNGFAYFYSAYSVYNVFLTMTTAGLPVAMSRMIAESNEQGYELQMQRTYSVAWWTFLTLGLLSAFLMLLLPKQLADMLDRPEAAESIFAMAPGILFVCLVSAYRGYCQGRKNMTPTTVGQVIEVLIKVVAGLALAIIFIRQNRPLPVVCAGATFGVTLGSMAVLVYMVWYKKRYYPCLNTKSSDPPMTRTKTLKTLLNIGIPITIGASGMSLISLIDTKFINNRLQMAAGFDMDGSAALYGVFSKAQTLYNLPPAFVTPLVMSVVPAVSAYLASKKWQEAGKTAEDALRITLVVCLPMGVGMSIIANSLMNIIYHGSHSSGPLILSIMGIASFFVCFSLVQNAVLQAHGNERLTIVSLLIGGAIKIAIDWILVGIPSINIYGAPIGTLVCYIVICILNQFFINHNYENRPKLKAIVIRPVLSALMMGGVTWGSYRLCRLMLPNDTRLQDLLVVIIVIFLSALAYVVAVIKTKAFTKEDLEMIPKGKVLIDKIDNYIHNMGKE